MVSIVTNATGGDGVCLRHAVYNWLRLLGDAVAELVVVVDTHSAVGRIARLQGPADGTALPWEPIRVAKAADARVRHVVLPAERELRRVGRKWFGREVSSRCQAGTPILGFLYGIEVATSPVVLRTDCDMVFHGRAWLSHGVRALESGSADIVEPPRLGCREPSAGPTVSTRAFMVMPEVLATRRLPLTPSRLDPLRRIHRRLTGRPTWLALEQTLQLEKQRERLRHTVLTQDLGYSMHVARRRDMAEPGFEGVLARFEAGRVPAEQRRFWDYKPESWSDAEPIRRPDVPMRSS